MKESGKLPLLDQNSVNAELLIRINDFAREQVEMKTHLVRQDVKLESIEAQTIKTNGRVSKIEEDRLKEKIEKEIEKASANADSKWTGTILTVVGVLVVGVVLPWLVWFLTTSVHVKFPTP